MLMQKVVQYMRHSIVQCWCFPVGFEPCVTHQSLTQTTGNWDLLSVMKFRDDAAWGMITTGLHRCQFPTD